MMCNAVTPWWGEVRVSFGLALKSYSVIANLPLNDQELASVQLRGSKRYKIALHHPPFRGCNAVTLQRYYMALQL